MDYNSMPEPYSMIEHEVGNLLSSIRVAERDPELRLWEDFEDFISYANWYRESFKKGNVEQREAAKRQIKDFLNYDDTPERSKKFIELVIDAYEAVEAYEDALSEGPPQPIKLDQVLSGAELEAELADTRRLDPEHNVVYENEDLKDVEIYGNKSLWILPHTAIINSRKHAEADNIEVSVTDERDEVIVSVRDDGKGIGMTEQEFLGKGNKGSKAIEYLSERFFGDWYLDSEDGEFTEFNFKFSKT